MSPHPKILDLQHSLLQAHSGMDARTLRSYLRRIVRKREEEHAHRLQRESQGNPRPNGMLDMTSLLVAEYQGVIRSKISVARRSCTAPRNSAPRPGYSSAEIRSWYMRNLRSTCSRPSSSTRYVLA